MNFELSEDQKIIQQIVQEFFEKEWPMDRTREVMADPKGYDPALWKEMTQLGYTRLIVPEAYEGTDGDFLELTLFMEEMGKRIVPSPFFTTVCQCIPALLEYGTDEQKASILPRIGVKGEIWSFALTETRGDHEASDIRLNAVEMEDSFVLNGAKRFVPFANAAGYLLVAARTQEAASSEDGVTFFMVATDTEGIHIDEIPTVAPGVKCDVRFDDVSVSKKDILGKINAGWQIVDHVLQYGAVLKAAEMSGGIQVVLDMSVKYAKERIQFDRPIVSFQVIQHDLVKMLVAVEKLKHQVYEAAWYFSIGKPSRMLNAMAKAKANDIYHRICYDAIGIHGAIGWTEEMDISLYLLRSKDLENDCGSGAFHKERVARELEVAEPAFKTLSGY